VTLGQIAQAVRNSSLDLPGGAIDTTAGEVIIRASAKRYTAEEFENIPVITKPDGSVILLSDIAEVIDGFEDVELQNSFDGKPAVLVDIFRVGGQDTLVLAGAAKEYVEGLRNELPQGINVEIWNDMSIMLEGRFDISINMISLFAFILVLGVVVDDSIVVGENVYTKIWGGWCFWEVLAEHSVDCDSYTAFFTRAVEACSACTFGVFKSF